MITNHDVLELLSVAVQSGRDVRIPVSGRSMGPAFGSVCEVVVRPVVPSCLTLGSIIVFQRNDQWIVHRIMWKSRGQFILKGDGLRQLDQPRVMLTEIKGLVVGLVLEDGTTVNLCSVRARVRGVLRVVRGWIGLLLASDAIR